MASRAEKKGMVPEETKKARTTVKTEETKPEGKIPTSEFDRLMAAIEASKKETGEKLAASVKEIQNTIGAHGTRLDRHRKELDDHERRIAALEGKAPKAPSEAEKEAEAEKAEAPKPETTDKAKPEADKVKTDLLKPCFDDAPTGAYGIIYVYEHEHENRLTGKIEKRWKKTFSEAMQASNGKYLGKRRAWVDQQGNYLRHLTPAEIERYYPGGEIR
jgi:hypothetical protein